MTNRDEKGKFIKGHALGKRFIKGHKLNLGKERTDMIGNDWAKDNHPISEFKKNDYRLIKENNHNWKGGVSTEYDKIRHGVESRKWKKQVIEKDKKVCQKCGETNCELHAHHIHNFHAFEGLRFVVDNGITFCKKCHNEFHKLFGQKNNDEVQVDGFIIGQNI